jgi:hypothetical protein
MSAPDIHRTRAPRRPQIDPLTVIAAVILGTLLVLTVIALAVVPIVTGA